METATSSFSFYSVFGVCVHVICLMMSSVCEFARQSFRNNTKGTAVFAVEFKVQGIFIIPGGRFDLQPAVTNTHQQKTNTQTPITLSL